jgi:hypothetical protein
MFSNTKLILHVIGLNILHTSLKWRHSDIAQLFGTIKVLRPLENVRSVHLEDFLLKSVCDDLCHPCIDYG